MAHLRTAALTLILTLAACGQDTTPSPTAEVTTSTPVASSTSDASGTTAVYTPSTRRTATTQPAESPATEPTVPCADATCNTTSSDTTAPPITLSVPVYDPAGNPACGVVTQADISAAFGSGAKAVDPGSNPAAYYTHACSWNVGGTTLTVELYTDGTVDVTAYYNTIKSNTAGRAIAGVNGIIADSFPVAYVLRADGSMVGLVAGDNSSDTRGRLLQLAAGV